jgi:hypothetical protein
VVLDDDGAHAAVAGFAGGLDHVQRARPIVRSAVHVNVDCPFERGGRVGSLAGSVRALYGEQEQQDGKQYFHGAGLMRRILSSVAAGLPRPSRLFVAR